jgi:uncharacterized membrane protein YeaQ/YmgE (transglycosylase-associated protein family)
MEEPVFDVVGKVTLYQGNWIVWLVIGLLAGAIAGRLTRGKGYGCLGDMVLGLIGAFVGGLIVSAFVNSQKSLGFWASVAVSVVGAVVVIFATRLVRRAV